MVPAEGFVDSSSHDDRGALYHLLEGNPEEPILQIPGGATFDFRQVLPVPVFFNHNIAAERSTGAAVLSEPVTKVGIETWKD
jgi:hypothetical protein